MEDYWVDQALLCYETPGVCGKAYSSAGAWKKSFGNRYGHWLGANFGVLVRLLWEVPSLFSTFLETLAKGLKEQLLKCNKVIKYE